MKAWIVRGKGDPWDVFEMGDFPAPTHEALTGYTVDLAGLRTRNEGEPPADDYVFMRVRAATLATPDITMATGEYPIPIERPYVSGQEAVGIVEEATENLRHLIGKRVVGFTPQPWGCFAEQCVALGSALYEAPESMSDEEAAAFVIAGHTAYQAVHRRGKVQPGERVLVLGAAGGVPSSAVQLCVAAGAEVVAVAGGPEKAEFCRKLGATLVIDHRAEDFVAAVHRACGPNSIDMIVDFVQGEAGARARPLLAVEGRHVMAGHAGGLIPIHPNEFYVQNWTLIGCCMGSGYGDRLPEIEDTAHRHLLSLVEDGRYQPQVGRVIGFDDIPEGLRALAGRRVSGRIVARVE
ncbi:MAG: zinc-binding dehydrogenase [Myxococcota bacterium]